MDRRRSDYSAYDDITVMAETSAPGTGGRTDDNDYLLAGANASNAVHQRRRVNPESLALRLGPDLVRDLDALITPGNTEMPSFAVRKELQERYNIDRRHIYDYFHSRGLRVVKEDKHGSPMAAKDLPTPLPNLRPLRQAPIKNVRSHSSHPVAAERKLFKPRGITKAKPGRPKKSPAVNLKVAPASTCETNEPDGPHMDTAAVSEHSPVPAHTYVAVNPLLPHVPQPEVEEDNNCVFNSAVNPLDESFSVARAIGDIAYAYRHKLVFERMQELVGPPAKLAPTEDRSLSWNEISSPCSASGKGLLLPHAKALTGEERHAIYDTLSSSLGPAHGIQECQGTYRKHMESRTKLYFEGLLSAPCQSSQLSARTSTLLDRKPPLRTNEFRHWLSETRFLKRDGINGSPRPYSSHRNAHVAKHHDIDGATDKQFRQRSNPHWIQTLDELFPAPDDQSNDGDPITDSPVLHTREATGMAAHTRGVANQCNAGDQLLFTAAPSTSLPILLATTISIAEKRPTGGHDHIHGHPGFPGPQQLQTSVAGTDDDPLWADSVPCAAPIGQQPALSHTQRRGRNISSNARSRFPSGSPLKHQIRDLDRVWTRPVPSRDARRRTPSAAGDI